MPTPRPHENILSAGLDLGLLATGTDLTGRKGLVFLLDMEQEVPQSAVRGLHGGLPQGGAGTHQ